MVPKWMVWELVSLSLFVKIVNWLQLSQYDTSDETSIDRMPSYRLHQSRMEVANAPMVTSDSVYHNGDKN